MTSRDLDPGLRDVPGGDVVKPLLVALLTVASVACRAPRNPRTFHDAMLAISKEWKPKVGRRMGTYQDVNIFIDTERVFLDESCLGGTSDEHDIVGYSPDLQSMPLIAWHYAAAHEMVHVHAGDYWDTMPLYLEEGLAHTIALSLLPEAREMVEELMRSSDRVGYEIVGQLGVEGVRKLAKRAQREGLDEIPEAWLRME